MITTINLSADKLNLSILRSIKEAYKGKEIEIIITDTKESESTDILLKRMKNLRKNRNIVTFTQDNFFKTYQKKIADASI